MEPILWEWINALARWLHVITAIAWIGSSFYFIHLDASLRRRAGAPAGTAGDAWQIHGGGFYHMTKYMVAPPQLPEELTWFKWESYATWLSGFFLMCVLYYRGADLFLIDQDVMVLGHWQAVAISVAVLVAGWVAYDLMCKSPLGRNDGALAIAGFVLLVATAWGLTKIFSGRGAMLQVGALMATMMACNVFMLIIPNQRKTVAAMLRGETPDPSLGKQAKQRSLHNNYLTLPVVFLMLSNHYPLVSSTRYNWVMVALVLVVGTAIRHFFNSRHAGKPTPWWTWGVAAAGMLACVWLSTMGPVGGGRGGPPPPGPPRAAAPPPPPLLRRSRSAMPRWRRSSPPAAACVTPPSRYGRASPPRRAASFWRATASAAMPSRSACRPVSAAPCPPPTSPESRHRNARCWRRGQGTLSNPPSQYSIEPEPYARPDHRRPCFCRHPWAPAQLPPRARRAGGFRCRALS